MELGSGTAETDDGDKARIAKNLATRILMQKKAVVLEDPEFQKKPKAEQEQILQYYEFKSDTFNNMDKMIESLKKYREEYCVNRKPKLIGIIKQHKKRKSTRKALNDAEVGDQSGAPSRSPSRESSPDQRSRSKSRRLPKKYKQNSKFQPKKVL